MKKREQTVRYKIIFAIFSRILNNNIIIIRVSLLPGHNTKKIDYLGSSGTYCTPCTAQLRESTNQKREAFCLCPKQPITVQSSQGHVTSYCRAKFDEKCFEKSLDGAFIQKVVLKWPFVVIQRHLFFIECRYLVYSVTRFDYFLIQKWHFLTVNCTFPTAD